MNTKIILISMMTTVTLISEAQKITYPVTKKVKQQDTYFGTKVNDPYRWLEDDKSAATAEWVKAQNNVTNNYLASLPQREEMKQRLTELWDYPKMGVPFRHGNFLFYYKNSGTQNQSVLYVIDQNTNTERILLDPNSLSKDGTLSLGNVSVTKDGKFLAYSYSQSGSDWSEIRIIDVEKGTHFDDTLKWVKFSGIAWKDNGFYYSRYDAPKGSALSQKNEFHKVYYHDLNTPQSKDRLIYENPKAPLRNYSLSMSDNKAWEFLDETESTSGNALWFRKSGDDKAIFTPISKDFTNDYSIIEEINGQFLMMTNQGAPNMRLVWVDPKNPDVKNWKPFLNESESVIQSAQIAYGMVYVQTLEKAQSVGSFYSYEGKLIKTLGLPGLGTINGFSGDIEDPVAYYGFTSFTYPSSIFKLDMVNLTSTIFFEPKIDFNPSDYKAEQVIYKSKDGTPVSMFIIHHKSIKMDGTNPTLLYGYGGFNVSLTPSFSISRLLFLEQGGVIAIPNLRGGGEYGQKWHLAGTKLTKQNTFDDFIFAAQYLIDNKYTSNARLAIQGGSNGGLLVGACMTQRPDLFKVAIPQVGVLDMLRYHLFTIGWAWKTDYGCSDNKQEFAYLYKYSPLHNLKKGIKYPATLITTADHDDRVVPAHSFKFAATLQECQTGENPTLIRIESKAGHGAGKPTAKTIEEAVDIWAFIFNNLGFTYLPKPELFHRFNN